MSNALKNFLSDPTQSLFRGFQMNDMIESAKARKQQALFAAQKLQHDSVRLKQNDEKLRQSDADNLLRQSAQAYKEYRDPIESLQKGAGLDIDRGNLLARNEEQNYKKEWNAGELNRYKEKQRITNEGHVARGLGEYGAGFDAQVPLESPDYDGPVINFSPGGIGVARRDPTDQERQQRATAGIEARRRDVVGTEAGKAKVKTDQDIRQDNNRVEQDIRGAREKGSIKLFDDLARRHLRLEPGQNPTANEVYGSLMSLYKARALKDKTGKIKAFQPEDAIEIKAMEDELKKQRQQIFQGSQGQQSAPGFTVMPGVGTSDAQPQQQLQQPQYDKATQAQRNNWSNPAVRKRDLQIWDNNQLKNFLQSGFYNDLFDDQDLQYLDSRGL